MIKEKKQRGRPRKQPTKTISFRITVELSDEIKRLKQLKQLKELNRSVNNLLKDFCYGNKEV
jgi:hypothetical protein